MAVPVSAAPPVVETIQGVLDYPVDIIDCPGIEVWDYESYTITITSYYDDQGNLLRAHQRFSGTDNLYNPANPGVVLTGRFGGAGHLDVRTGIWYYSGVPFHITVPGYGTVMVRAGRWYGPDHLAGKDSLLSPEDMEQLCSCLASQ
jgi:hypothetical protein